MIQVFGKLIVVVSILMPSLTFAQSEDSIFSYQQKNRRDLSRGLVIDGDTISLEILDEVLLFDEPSFNSAEARRRYEILKRKVIKVYPYAVIAGDKLDSLNFALSLITKKKQRKRYIKDFQAYLEDEFSDQLKRLTRSEGQILNKLIYRETGRSTYQLIKDHRSFMKAFWYNTMANFYDISLKRPYQPDQDDEDELIEMILNKAFLEGKLIEREPKVFSKDDFPELTR
ncbi:MAG: DUF4294 domain-containing protein [Cryomorphaceae bacterium]|nr:DUF4294 domain-containing protein [Cryomorphaceae bacterium]